MNKKESPVIIPAIDLKHFELTVVGDTPLIVHKWSQKAKQMILDKEMKKPKAKGHDVKNPVEDFIESLYWLSKEPTDFTEEVFSKALKANAKFGFPSTAFKAAAVSAGYRAGVMKDKVSTNGAFHITPNMVEIVGTPHMREDMVRVGMGSADIRYRGEFSTWKAVLPITYNASVYSMEQITNLFNLGGFACGVGEWRPEKGGNNGMFHVE